MRHATLITEFRQELSKVAHEVEMAASAGHVDINHICENLVCGLFREIYGLDQLRNLNDEEKKNFPGIDLADDKNKVAVQVTSEKTIEKVKDTLSKFVKNKLYEKYDRLIVYILTRKQTSYSQTSIDKAAQAKITFSTSTDIIDSTDLATRAAGVAPSSLKKAADILGSYTRGVDVGLSDIDFDPPEQPTEKLGTSLIELYIPPKVYIADVLPEILESTKGRKVFNQRKIVGAYTREVDLRVPSDYEVHSGKFITFWDLEKDNPFNHLIDKGTVEPLSSGDFYGVDDDYERVFKSLLRFSLQTKLYKHRIQWKPEEKLFVFLPVEDEDNIRKVSWTGQKKSTRTVFERKFYRNDPKKVLSTRHFGFSADFILIEGQWYITIFSDWFFSYGNDYRRSNFGDKLLSGLKRMERNRSVYDQFRFIAAWLSELDTEDLFSEDAHMTPKITFGKSVELSGGRELSEEFWAPLKAPQVDDPNQERMDWF